MKPNGKMGLNGDPGGDVHVVVSESGKEVASMTTSKDGKFSFVLAPGHYVVSGCASFKVDIVLGQITKHDLTCPVP
jgi:hypothetical protein